MIRVATLDDLPWLMELARHAYPAPMYDERAATVWTKAIIVDPHCLLLRGERAALAAMSRDAKSKASLA